MEYLAGKAHSMEIEVHLYDICCPPWTTVLILNFPTDRSGQIVQTQIRLLLEEQSDQGFHCLPFHLHVFDKIPLGLVS